MEVDSAVAKPTPEDAPQRGRITSAAGAEEFDANDQGIDVLGRQGGHLPHLLMIAGRLNYRPVAVTNSSVVSSGAIRSSTGWNGASSPKQAGPKTSSASGVRIIAGVEMPTTVTRCP